MAHAVVVAGDVPYEPTRRLLARLREKGVRVLAVGHARGEPAPAHEEPETPRPRYTRLPD